MAEPVFTNDAVVLGILMAILAFVFISSKSQHPFWKKFYTYVPTLLLCYFIPSIFNSLGIISGEESKLYFVASRYLLPTSLVLLTISIDLPEIKKLGPKALIMFFTGTLGIIMGGPLAILLVSAFAPDVIGGAGPEAIWRGLSTVAGSWIGGGANQAAMKEIFGVGDTVFSAMIAVDVIVANVWMAFLLYGAGIHERLDSWLQADTSAIMELKEKIEAYRAQIIRIPDLTDAIKVMAVGFGITAIAHLGADTIAPAIQQHAPGLARFSLTSGFFWLIVLATTLALAWAIPGQAADYVVYQGENPDVAVARVVVVTSKSPSSLQPIDLDAHRASLVPTYTGIGSMTACGGAATNTAEVGALLDKISKAIADKVLTAINAQATQATTVNAAAANNSTDSIDGPLLPGNGSPVFPSPW